MACILTFQVFDGCQVLLPELIGGIDFGLSPTFHFCSAGTKVSVQLIQHYPVIHGLKQ